MEKESFEDSSVADLMNNTFINIKVDREERPDIDSVYMTVCQMLTGSGGWPMTIIMTPDKKPFFAGTYFPKNGNYGRMGMTELVPRIADLWMNKRDELLHSSAQILEALKQTSQSFLGDDFDEKILKKAYKQLAERFDVANGGFGGSPKFPSPHILIFLLRYANKNPNSDAQNIVETTLQAIRNGGIYDQLGGGIHRYSTDKYWLLPHFEKMLYDQALFVLALVETFQLTKNVLYKTAAVETLDFVLEEFFSEEGGFFSALDADSEGEEGKYYLWSLEEIKNIPRMDADIFTSYFNVKEEGNFFDPALGGFTKQNILHITSSPSKVATSFDITVDEFNLRILTSLSKLKEERRKRIHPFKDDKILTDWNGLMIAAFAKAGAAFDNIDFINAAEKSFSFIIEKMKDKNGKLLHRFREGEAAFDAIADDYAYLIFAGLELYYSTFKIEYLNGAVMLQNIFFSKFWDEDYGGFYFTASDSEELLVRQKEIYDGAIPSANSISLSNLSRLYKLTGEQNYFNKAVDLVRAFYNNISSVPTSYTQFLSGIDLHISESSELVIVEDSAESIDKSILNALRENYFPSLTVIVKDKNNGEKLSEISPFTKELKVINDKLTFYLCKNFSCSLPTNDFESILKKLKE